MPLKSPRMLCSYMRSYSTARDDDDDSIDMKGEAVEILTVEFSDEEMKDLDKGLKLRRIQVDLDIYKSD